MSKSQIGCRLEHLKAKGDYLAEVLDGVIYLKGKVKEYCLDKDRIDIFYGYISAELLDLDTERQVLQGDYDNGRHI